MLGIFSATLFVDAISVYILHDVDQDQIGRWNAAFAGLCIESVLFTLIIGGSVWLLTLLGRRLFDLRNSFPRVVLSFFLGAGVTALQYPLEFVVRKLFPRLSGSFLSLYLILAIVACTVVLLRDNFQQLRLRKALEPPTP